jgi:hypothetical protein
MSHQATQLKTLPAPTVKKLIRDAGWTMTAIAALKPPRNRSLVARVVRKQIVSDPVWERIAWCLNHPRTTVAA